LQIFSHIVEVFNFDASVHLFGLHLEDILEVFVRVVLFMTRINTLAANIFEHFETEVIPSAKIIENGLW
jgi:hypothetical protein